MDKRKRLTKQERQHIYQMFGGRCAYCGTEMSYSDMQIDHIVPLRSDYGNDSLDNMFPACRPCNHYKRGNTLEGWRSMIEKSPEVLLRDCYTYRQAVRFGTVIPSNKKVFFYFERIDTHE